MQRECPTNWRVHHPHGFSLAEMLVAVSIMGLMAAIAVPSMSSLAEHYRINVSSNALMTAFTMARQSAITKNQVVTICAGIAQSGCHNDWSSGQWLIFTDRNRNGKPDLDETVVQEGSAKLGRSVRIMANRSMKMPILFHPIGHAEQPNGAFAAGTLRICAESTKAAPGVDLVLSKSGQMRAQDHIAGASCTAP
jgi:type IV fimbrial biogenesis protein FimT